MDSIISVGWKMLSSLFWATAGMCAFRELKNTVRPSGWWNLTSWRRIIPRFLLPTTLFYLGSQIRRNARATIGEDLHVDAKAVYWFYMGIWKIFYASYALLPPTIQFALLGEKEKTRSKNK